MYEPTTHRTQRRRLCTSHLIHLRVTVLAGCVYLRKLTLSLSASPARLSAHSFLNRSARLRRLSNSSTASPLVSPLAPAHSAATDWPAAPLATCAASDSSSDESPPLNLAPDLPPASSRRLRFAFFCAFPSRRADLAARRSARRRRRSSRLSLAPGSPAPPSAVLFASMRFLSASARAASREDGVCCARAAGASDAPLGRRAGWALHSRSCRRRTT